MAVSPWVSGPLSHHRYSALLSWYRSPSMPKCQPDSDAIFTIFQILGQALHMGRCAWSSSSGIGPHFWVSVPVWAPYSSLPALGSLTGDVQKLQARAGGTQECAQGPHCAVTFEAKVLCPSSDLEARRHVCQRLEF